MSRRRTVDAAKGKWRGILMSLGMPETALAGRHGPCPICGGEDRFRWDNKEGRGTFYCSHCGPGDGMKLAERVTGLPFREVATRIDEIVGNLPQETTASRPEMTDTDITAMQRQIWALSRPIQPGDIADRYLASRGIARRSYPLSVRFCPRLRDGAGGFRPALVAVVSASDRKGGTLHRTFLNDKGTAKAEMTSPRKLLPGSFPKGGAVRLADWMGGPLGIAEGIETAMSASLLFRIPVWAAICAANLAKWIPPDGCDEVAIFGDHDISGCGQKAAYALSSRLKKMGITVAVHIPLTLGEDWNDEWKRQKGKRS
jgi:putative DNA primase/helicase